MVPASDLPEHRVEPSPEAQSAPPVPEAVEAPPKEFDIPAKILSAARKRKPRTPPHYEVAADFGSRHMRLVRSGEDSVLWEPNVLVRDREGREFAGADAERFERFAPPGATVIRPVQRGEVVDFQAAARVLHRGIRRVSEPSGLKEPGVILTVPTSASPVQIQVRHAVAREAGASHVLLVHSAACQFLGSGGDPSSSRATLLLSLGASVTEIAVVSAGHVLAAQAIPFGGDDLDSALRDHLRFSLQVGVGLRDAHEMKKRLSLEWGRDPSRSLAVNAYDYVTGVPRQVEIPVRDLQRVIDEWLERLLRPLRRTLEALGPEPTGDLCENGITLLGGGALLPRVDEFIRRNVPIPIRYPSRYLNLWLAEILGAEILLNNLDRLERLAFRDVPKIPDLNRLEPTMGFPAADRDAGDGGGGTRKVAGG
jgi:rod shape-determining protein MreB